MTNSLLRLKNFAKFALPSNAKIETSTFFQNIFFQSNLKSLKSSKPSICDEFSFSFVFVIFIFAIFKDRAFTSLFTELEDVYVLNYKL